MENPDVELNEAGRAEDVEKGLLWAVPKYNALLMGPLGVLVLQAPAPREGLIVES